MGRRWAALAISSAMVLAAGAASAQQKPRRPLAQFPLDELAKVDQRVQTAGATLCKRPRPSVITQEDIRRSGAYQRSRSLAPGVHVARINSNQWAMGVRGFGSRLATSVLSARGAVRHPGGGRKNAAADTADRKSVV